MKIIFQVVLLAFIVTSCSHQKRAAGMSLTTASSGLIKNHIASFPIYLTGKIEKRVSLEKKYSQNVFIIHTGHVLKANLSKIENENTLMALAAEGYNLINLSLEDFAVANAQGIDFENFENLSFINSSVIDLNRDDLATAKNITPFFSHEEVTFIGLSDTKLDKKLTHEKFILSDYVLSVLKAKKQALNTAAPNSFNSFIIVHTLGSEINDVMVRLPPSFINSLAN
ncbi:MAG: hypothetical protein EHM20_14840 [Alphaproteobacteria bacterium]|nr:MAG: hypothetical protein EHM20_14840 [Alphaproteobacteria bacterium]